MKIPSLLFSLLDEHPSYQVSHSAVDPVLTPSVSSSPVDTISFRIRRIA